MTAEANNKVEMLRSQINHTTVSTSGPARPVKVTPPVGNDKESSSAAPGDVMDQNMAFFWARLDCECSLGRLQTFLVYDVRRESTAMALLEVQDLDLDVISRPFAHLGENSSELGADILCRDSAMLSVSSSFELQVKSRNLRAQREARQRRHPRPNSQVSSANNGWEPVIEGFKVVVLNKYTAYFKPHPGTDTLWQRWFRNPMQSADYLFASSDAVRADYPHSNDVSALNPLLDVGQLGGSHLWVSVAIDPSTPVNFNVTESLAENVGRFHKIYEARQRRYQRAASSSAVFSPANALTLVATASARRVFDEQRRRAAAAAAAETSPLRLRNGLNRKITVCVMRREDDDVAAWVEHVVPSHTPRCSFLSQFEIGPGEEKSVPVAVANDAGMLAICAFELNDSATQPNEGFGDHLLAQATYVPIDVADSFREIISLRRVGVENLVGDSSQDAQSASVVDAPEENAFCRVHMYEEDPPEIVQPVDDDDDDFFFFPREDDDGVQRSHLLQKQVRVCSFEPVFEIKNCLPCSCEVHISTLELLRESGPAPQTDGMQGQDADKALACDASRTPQLTIAQGDTYVHLRSQLGLYVFVRCPGFRWSAPIPLQERDVNLLPSSFAIPVNIQDFSGVSLSVVARVRAKRSGSLHVALYAPYVIRNKTSLPLLIKCGGTSGHIAVGQHKALSAPELMVTKRASTLANTDDSNTTTAATVEEGDRLHSDSLKKRFPNAELATLYTVFTSVAPFDPVMLGYAPPGQDQRVRICLSSRNPGNQQWCAREISLANPATHEVAIHFNSDNFHSTSDVDMSTSGDLNQAVSASSQSAASAPASSPPLAQSELALGIEVRDFRAGAIGGRFTREVVIVPRFTVINELPVAIRVQQIGAQSTLHNSADPDGGPEIGSPAPFSAFDQTLLIESGNRAPFHWTNRDSVKLFQCTFDEPGWAWSGAVSLSDAVVAASAKAKSKLLTTLSTQANALSQVAAAQEVAEPHVIFLRLHHIERKEVYVAQLTFVVRGAAVAVVVRPEEVVSVSSGPGADEVPPSASKPLAASKSVPSQKTSIQSVRPLPYRIENSSTATLVFRQRNEATESVNSWLPKINVVSKAAAAAGVVAGGNITTDIVHPHTSCPYALDEPTMPAMIVVKLAEDNESAQQQKMHHVGVFDLRNHSAHHVHTFDSVRVRTGPKSLVGTLGFGKQHKQHLLVADTFCDDDGTRVLRFRDEHDVIAEREQHLREDVRTQKEETVQEVQQISGRQTRHLPNPKSSSSEVAIAPRKRSSRTDWSSLSTRALLEKALKVEFEVSVPTLCVSVVGVVGHRRREVIVLSILLCVQYADR